MYHIFMQRLYVCRLCARCTWTDWNSSGSWALKFKWIDWFHWFFTHLYFMKNTSVMGHSYLFSNTYHNLLFQCCTSVHPILLAVSTFTRNRSMFYSDWVHTWCSFIFSCCLIYVHIWHSFNFCILKILWSSTIRTRSIEFQRVGMAFVIHCIV